MKYTNKIAFASLAALIGGWALIHAESKGHDDHGNKTAAADTLTGEVVDLACFLGHGEKGKDHAKCAKQCIQKGLPVGLLTEKGEVYLAIGPDHKKANELLASKAAQVVTVVGKKSENFGAKMIEVHGIVKTDTEVKAAPIPVPAKMAYACPMHSEVRQDGPGKCPKCGMALEKTGK